MRVPSSLILRSRSHFHALPFAEIDMILGLNGWCWISKRRPYAAEDTPAEKLYSNENEYISEHERDAMARIGNSIKFLVKNLVPISYGSVVEAYELGLKWTAKDLLNEKTGAKIARDAANRVAMDISEI